MLVYHSSCVVFSFRDRSTAARAEISRTVHTAFPAVQISSFRTLMACVVLAMQTVKDVRERATSSGREVVWRALICY